MFEAGSIGIRAVWQDAEARQAADAFYRDLKTKRDQFQQQGGSTTAAVGPAAAWPAGARPLPYQAPSNAGTYVAGPRFLQAGMMPGMGGGNTFTTATSAVAASAQAAVGQSMGGVAQFSLLLNSASAAIRAFTVALNQASFGGGGGGVSPAAGPGGMPGVGGGGSRGMAGGGGVSLGFFGRALGVATAAYAAHTVLGYAAGTYNAMADARILRATSGASDLLQFQAATIRKTPFGDYGMAAIRFLTESKGSVIHHLNPDNMLIQNAKDQATVAAAESAVGRMARTREAWVEREGLRRETESLAILSPWGQRRHAAEAGFSQRSLAADMKISAMEAKADAMKKLDPLKEAALREDISHEKNIEYHRIQADAVMTQASLGRTAIELKLSNFARGSSTRAAMFRAMGRGDLASSEEFKAVVAIARQTNPEELGAITDAAKQRQQEGHFDHMMNRMAAESKVRELEHTANYKPITASLERVMQENREEVLKAGGGIGGMGNLPAMMLAMRAGQKRLQIFRQELYLRGQAAEIDPTATAFGVMGPLEGISGPAFAAGQAQQKMNPADAIGDLMSSLKNGLMGMIKDIKLLN